MQSIQTTYHGIEYRSRLEARWACFLDVLDVPFQYEPETFKVGEDVWYLPDFWLPRQETWIEIKGDVPTEIERRKAIGLFRVTRKAVFIFSEFPMTMRFVDNRDLDKHIWEICNFGIFAVDAQDPKQCRHYPESTLNEAMLTIFGWADESTGLELFYHHTARLVSASRQSLARFKHIELEGDLSLRLHW